MDIIIEDALLANAAKFDCKYIGAINGIKFSTGAPYGSSTYGEFEDFGDGYLFDPVTIKSTEKGMMGYSLSKFAMGSTNNITVEIRCYDINNKLIVKKIVNKVHVYSNKPTIVRGKLFTNSSQASFNVTVNSDWNPETENVNF